MITSIAYILVLALPGAFGAVPANPQSQSDGVKLAEILTKGSWEYLTNAGTPDHPIALESITLTFCADGRLRQRIGNDTGVYDEYGKWKLERTANGDLLILSYEPLVWPRYGGGRIRINYFEKEKAFDMLFGSGTLRFQSVTEHEPCTPPKLMERASMPIDKLADVLTKGSWVFGAYVGPPTHRIAIESRTLTFCWCGHVRERIVSDGGGMGGYLYGTWALEHTDHGEVLTLSGGQLLDHGRFSIKYLEKEKAFDLWVGSAESVVRFYSVKTEDEPCTPPKLMDRASMPIDKLADVLTKESWYYEASVGPPNHRISFEGRTLTFCACGHVQEGISDDTGIYRFYGKWALEGTDDGDVLILSSEPGIWPHGRIPIKYFEKEKAFDMWSGSYTLRFQSVKRYIPDPCTAPKGTSNEVRLDAILRFSRPAASHGIGVRTAICGATGQYREV